MHISDKDYIFPKSNVITKESSITEKAAAFMQVKLNKLKLDLDQEIIHMSNSIL